MGVFILLLVLACSCLHGVQSATRHDIQVLQDKLFLTYNRDLGPSFNQSQPVALYILFNLFTLNEFDDKTGKLVFLGFSTIQWQDDRLIWDPVQHGNTTEIMIPQSKVWIPHLFVAKPYNNVKKIGNDFVHVAYTADGWANWAVPDLFEVSCTANVAYYPFDRQTCEIYIIPWAYAEGIFDFRLPLDAMTQEEFIENGIWKVLSTEMTVQKHTGGDFVVMVIKFQRRPLFAILNLLLPIVVIGVLNVFVFLLPPEPGERSAFGVTVLLAMAVFLSIVSDKLPSTSEPHIARITLYILSELIISALIMVFTVFTLVLYSNKDDKSIPQWVKRLVLACSKRRADLKQGPRDHRSDVDKPNRPRQRHWPPENERYVNDNMEINDKNKRYANTNTEHYGHVQGRLNQNHGERPYTASTDRQESVVEDTHPSVTWNVVAKWFDNVCLALFIFLNICLLVVQITDSANYMNAAF
ncbi:Neuronal acetylcholine receptor subunit beta-3 [Mizuhopecten yessoensis]|uniref:Neuronal acetylcholine receptor subunit beta-3 n=1 Tax=Mizuhopecten yessoensis TaxID=6573 RepID=A0A210QJE1_MIZYE|nr:Neuronal acetylcholine receptor subunit beta-3 [Mizuhopecten yessoensis]